MAKKIVTNNLKKILKEKGLKADWVRSELKRIKYPINVNRFSLLMQNKTEIYFGEAVFISEILEIRDYNDLVNGNIKELKTVE